VTSEKKPKTLWDITSNNINQRTKTTYKLTNNYLLLLAEGDAAGEFAGAVELDGCATGCVAAGDVAGAGVGVAVGVVGDAPCKTDLPPLNEGNASVNAANINTAAAPTVIFARRLAVPRGPKAVLDKPLENNAPASALPGCRRMLIMRTTQDRMNSPYRM
jgi:hypothetical protein